MQHHPFATLVTAPTGRPFAMHLSLLVQREEAIDPISHMARANLQWQYFGSGQAFAIFHGPHTLVHSALYDGAPNVPTWNYAVVHAYGQASIVEGERKREIAYKLVAE